MILLLAKLPPRLDLAGCARGLRSGSAAEIGFLDKHVEEGRGGELAYQQTAGAARALFEARAEAFLEAAR